MTLRNFKNTLSYLVIILVVYVFNGSVLAEVSTPTAPSEKVLKTWLDVFNSGDQDKIQEFIGYYEWPWSIEGMLSFRNQTGGFDLVSIDRSTKKTIEFTVKERRGDVRALGWIELGDDSSRVKTAAFFAIPDGSQILGFVINSSVHEGVIDASVQKLRERYIFEDAAEAMVVMLEQRNSRGEYDSHTNGLDFAEILTAHMREISNDLHLRVNFNPILTPRPLVNAEPSIESQKQHQKNIERSNCGFEKIKILQGNVGYLKFNAFENPKVCGPTATAAMNFLQHVETLIIDLRDNKGGEPAMVAYITSYLFENPTHLNDIYDRTKNSTQQWWTLPYVPGKRLTDQVVYVLTSSRTFSAGEEFAYNLKALERATVIGEVTGGGAHPICLEWISEQFTLVVPCKRAINPITKSNWEGVGVRPDVEVSSNDALDKALELIAADLN